LRKWKRFDPLIGQATLLVGVTRQALPDPIAEIVKTPDCTDFVAAFVVLDNALADAVDLGRIIVEIANQRPHGFHGMIEYGAVVGLGHCGLRH
jgi:hypothetical protein